MKLSDFDYPLPENLIAQRPCAKRDEARLLVVERATGRLSHDLFKNIHRYLPPKSLIVVNNSKVIPARLLGTLLRTGREVEVFLLKKIDGRNFEAMLRPLKKIREGEPIEFPGGVRCALVDWQKRIVRFDEPGILKKLDEIGHMPLPPYIKRLDEASDRTDYQTVYAKRPGSVASPTAGLHFTKPLMASLKKAGHAFTEVTLHVNYATFKPVECEDITKHEMHFEAYEIPLATLQAVKAARAKGSRVVAVGTTSCRTLEAFARTGKAKDTTDLFLYPCSQPRQKTGRAGFRPTKFGASPGAEFKLTDALVTNFHLPKTTLLMLVSAFAGTELVRRAYAEALREKYRFFSYGDAMVIV